MALKLTLFTALVLASNPAHALDLKKELDRLRGGADATEAQTQAAPAAAASLRLGRAEFLDASRVAPPLTRLGAIVKPRVGITDLQGDGICRPGDVGVHGLPRLLRGG